MGSNLNFRNFCTNLPGEMGSDRLQDNHSLTRQSSIYSLTFNEFQSTVGGGLGKDLGSMNMDELLKNIWSAEENQNIGSTSGCGILGGSGGGGVDGSGGYLQRQGSLTLPRTISQKTVDEVWNDMSKEFSGGNNVTGATMTGFNMPQKQKTLGEITLEEFLVKAGVVREDAQMPNNGFSSDVNGSWLGFGGYQQQQQQQARVQSSNLPLNVNGERSTGQPQILPKQSTLAFGGRMEIPGSAQLASPGVVPVAVSDPGMSKTMVPNASMVGLGANGGVSAVTGSPAASSDGLTSNGDTSSVSPVPFVFNGSLRGRRSAAVEKVVERRQRRMIKNRESAARSRARKQAYTMELEAEVAKLKEENELLQKKQAEMMEMQKNQALERKQQQNGNKKRCLRRTQTGPW